MRVVYYESIKYIYMRESFPKTIRRILYLCRIRSSKNRPPKNHDLVAFLKVGGKNRVKPH